MSDLRFDVEMKELLCKYDFEFFVKQNIQEQKYPIENVNEIYSRYKEVKRELKNELSKNKKQYFLYLDGQVGKMFSGGLLPSLFNLNDVRQHVFLDFPAIGENWAYFEIWQNRYKNKITKKKLWKGIIATGSILGIILSIWKLIEVIKMNYEQ